MNLLYKKPILVGGISLTFLLFLAQQLSNYWDSLSNISILALMLLAGISFALPKKKTNSPPIILECDRIQQQDLDNKIVKIKDLITHVKVELDSDQNLTSEDKENILEQDFYRWENLLKIINSHRERQELKIAFLTNNLSNNLSYFIENDLENIKINIVNNYDFTVNSQGNLWLEKITIDNDLICYVLDGDLTNSDIELISQISKRKQKLLLIFDTSNFSKEDDINLIFSNWKNNLENIIDSKSIIKVDSKEKKVIVRKYADNHNYNQREETYQPQYQLLIENLRNLILNNQNQLILATAYRQAIYLEKQAKNKLNSLRKKKALKLMEKYQILTATTTFANPVVSLDLLATTAINAQMIMDLGKIYQHSLSLNQAQEISVAIGKLILKLGIVEISTQTIASILKTNFITYLMGGVIQGISAAYFTRLCALSLIEYYQNYEAQSKVNLLTIQKTIQGIFEENIRGNILNQFVKKMTMVFAPTEYNTPISLRK